MTRTLYQFIKNVAPRYLYDSPKPERLAVDVPDQRRLNHANAVSVLGEQSH
jgi:hypothetical protein